MKQVDAVIERLSKEFWLQKQMAHQSRRAERKTERDENSKRVAVKGIVLSHPVVNGETLTFDFQQESGKFIHVVISALLATPDQTEIQPGSKLQLYGKFDKGTRLLRAIQMAVYRA